LRHFYRAIEKKSKHFVDELLNTSVMIMEKIDGDAFSAEWKNGEWLFYKGHNKKEMNLLSRAISGRYEKYIQFILATDKEEYEFYSRIRFDFEIVDKFKPHIIEYDNVPPGGMILIGVETDSKQIIPNRHFLYNWSQYFGLDNPPIVFDDVLSPKQRALILLSNFHSNSINYWMYDCFLKPVRCKSYLQNNLEKPIEGFVLHFKKKDKPFIVKIVDPHFTSEIMKSKNPKKGILIERETTDSFLNDIIEYGKDWSTTLSEPLDVYSHIFEKYVQNLGVLNFNSKYDNLYNELPENLKRLYEVLNDSIIPESTMKMLLEYKNLAAGYINFLMILNSPSKNILSKFPGIENVRNYRIDYRKSVNVMIGKFQPITTGHLKVVDEMYNLNGLPTYFFIVRRKDSILSEFLTINIFNTLYKNNTKVAGYSFKKGEWYDTWLSELRMKGLEPVLLGCGEDRSGLYERNLYEINTKNNSNVELYVEKRDTEDISATKLKNAIIEDDKETIKKSFPKYLHGFLEKVKKELIN